MDSTLKHDDRHPVFVIDDDEAAREGLRMLIERSGYAVKTAPDGDVALDMLRAGLRPCIIVLDLSLKNFSGFAFREEQRKDAELADIPTIIQSGIYDVKTAAARLGAVAHFRKPYEVDQIIDAIHVHALKRQS